MIDGKTVLAIIPARGGSKGLPRKNVLPLAGKPLIAWTIEAANKSKYIDRCIVSTDDNEIASVANKFGAEVPFLRPSELSTDTASLSDVILHAIEGLGKNYDLLVLLQPTSPLRDENAIDPGIKCFLGAKVGALVSVSELDHPSEWSFQLNDLKIPKKVINELPKGKRRQDYPRRYQLNGALYICEVETFKTTRTFFMERTIAYIMDRHLSVDIDDEMDFRFAEFLIKENIVSI